MATPTSAAGDRADASDGSGGAAEAPADPEIAHLRTTIRRLRRRETVLRHRLAVTRWKLARLEGRRSVRLVTALAGALRRPAELLRLPVTLLRILTRPAPVPPRPVEDDAVRAAAEAEAAAPPPRPAGAPPPRAKPRLTPPELSPVVFPEGPVALPDLRVVTILDEFSARAFAYEASLTPLRPDSWQRTLDEVAPHLLLVESAWRGIDDRWRHHLTSPTPPSPELVELVAECRRRGIPTVFWNKEDPPNFDRFIDSAALFDLVLTVDRGSVARYLERLDHDRVAVLPFGAQPRIHNPLSPREGRDHGVAFAGTYYVDKHPHRKVQMMQVLEPARAFDLHIYARFGNTARAYRFPPPLDEHVVGKLSYAETLAAYRRYRVFLNVNSAPKSETMCARRIFELLACGAAVVSGPSPAIDHLLGPGLVAQSDDPDHTVELLTGLLHDDDARSRVSARGTRTILSQHTYRDRFATILDLAGLGGHGHPAQRLTAVVPCGGAPTTGLLDDLAAQERRPDEIRLVGPPDQVADARDRARQVVGAEVTVADGSTADAIDGSIGDLVAVLDPTTRYGRGYLLDQELAFRYVDTPAVAKGAHHTPGPSAQELQLLDPAAEHRPLERAAAGSLVVRRTALGPLPTGLDADELVGRLAAAGDVVGTSRYELVRPARPGEPVSDELVPRVEL